MISDSDAIERVVSQLCDLFEAEFGGKRRGRFRISEKFMRHMIGCVRIYPETIVALQREAFERGYVIIDMDSFFVVTSAKTLSSYRRAGSAVVGYDASSCDKGGPSDDDSDE